MGNYDEAEKVLQKAISLDGANIGALYDHSRLEIKRRNYATAVKYLERVTQLDRINPQAYYQLFLAYSRLKQADKANGALAEFKRLDALEKQSKSERMLDEKLRAAQLLNEQ
jgi:tetratricopeptide (TPR) repeat protein